MKKLNNSELYSVSGGATGGENGLGTNAVSIGFAGLNGNGNAVLCNYGPTGLTADKVHAFNASASNALTAVSNKLGGSTNTNPTDANGCPVYSDLP